MAILATSRRWLVTSLCAASRSSFSAQRLASMYSCWGSSIGNLRISARYRERPDSPLRTGNVAVRAISAPSSGSAPRQRRARQAAALLKPVALRCSALDIQRRCNIHYFGEHLEGYPPSRPRVADITYWHNNTFQNALPQTAARRQSLSRVRSDGKSEIHSKIVPFWGCSSTKRYACSAWRPRASSAAWLCGPRWLALVLKCGP